VARADRLGSEIGGCLVLMLNSSHELLQWQCHDDNTINIVFRYYQILYRLLLVVQTWSVVDSAI